MSKWRWTAAAAIALTASGCATRGPISMQCPIFDSVVTALPPSPLERDIQSDAADPASALAGRSLKDAAPKPDPLGDVFRLVQSRPKPMETPEKGLPAHTRPPPIEVLLLSGGGQWGAFGAGFLQQLQASPQAIDPQIITGVSTVGLQSLFAAVGTAQAYAAMTKEYSPARQSDLVNANPALLAAITGSMAGIKPLRRAIERALCAGGDPARGCPMIADLAGTPRQIRIGFVEAKTGQFLIANVNKMADYAAAAVTAGTLARADANRVARDCLTGAALASAGMPLFFQPVRINGKIYYDGGVRQSVFLASVAEAAAKSMLAPGGHAAAAPTFYVIRNGPTQLLGKDGKPGGDVEIDTDYRAITAALRAQSVIVNQVEIGSIAALRLFHPQGTINLATADGYPDWTDAAGGKYQCVKGKQRFFNPDFMACLRALGRAKAARPKPWIAMRALPAGKPES